MRCRWSLRSRVAVDVELRSCHRLDHLFCIICCGIPGLCRALLALQSLVQRLESLLRLALLAESVGKFLVLLLQILLLEMQIFKVSSQASTLGREQHTGKFFAQRHDLDVCIIDNIVHLRAKCCILVCQTPCHVILIHSAAVKMRATDYCSPCRLTSLESSDIGRTPFLCWRIP